MTTFNLLDAIINIKAIPFSRLTLVEPEYQSISCLPAGQVGTIVEIYSEEETNQEGVQYLVEFSDLKGREYAMSVLKPEEMLTIRYELSVA